MTNMYRLNAIENMTGYSAEDIMMYYNYPEETRLILRGCYQAAVDISPTLGDAIYSCKYVQDTRTDAQYAFDLSVNWLLEDYLYRVLSKYLSEEIWRSGGDADRTIKSFDGISGDADLSMEEFDIEIISTYNGSYLRNGYIPLRNNKLNNMKKSKKKVILLGVDVKNEKFFAMPITNNTHGEYTENMFGKKPGYVIKLENTPLIELGPNAINVAKTIKSITEFWG